MSFLKQNWFKLIIALTIFIVGLSFSLERIQFMRAYRECEASGRNGFSCYNIMNGAPR